MSAPRKTVPLTGSERAAARGSRVAGPVSGDESIEVRIALKAPGSLQKAFDDLAAQPVRERVHLTREEFASRFGCDEAGIGKIEQFAREHNLAVSRVERSHHAIYLRGAARDMSLAFNVYLERYENADASASWRGRTGPVHIPEELADTIVSVNGLDERPVATPKIRVREEHAAAAKSLQYTPQQIAALYSFPQAAHPGAGQTIGIVELGGGFRQTDLTKYFAGKGPVVTAVSVDSGHNRPTGKANGPDGEVMLDIEVAGAVAPSSNIAVYFSPNTNKGFLDCISAAVHDATRKPSVVSISWGSPEDGGGYSPSVLQTFQQIFQAAGVMGVTVLAAAGDNGSSDGVATGDHVDFPASSPFVTACGGTSLVSTDMKTIQSETVWNDGAQGGSTGGGVSTVFPVPTWQQGLRAAKTAGGEVALTGRGVPDIAADADPATGYSVLVDGQSFPIGGTSAVAPLMAGLVALLNQQIGKPLGFLNPTIYSLVGSPALRDITGGNNGTYAAAKGWDACTGVGAPVGTALLAALKGQGHAA